MKWYSIKLAENNPDEAHWTHRRFVDPGDPEFRLFQPQNPENERNLPDGYYAELRARWSHRPDLQRRFLDGKFGFQAIGKAVTPEWADEIHLSKTELAPVRGSDLLLCWDFGLNATCVITQATPLGFWNILHSFVMEGEGVEQLIELHVRPLLRERYRGYRWRHTGDPSGNNREQSNSKNFAVKSIRRLLGGPWFDGPRIPDQIIEPMRSALTRINQGRGVVQVDKRHAQEVWWALRGGWHHDVAHTGTISPSPKKDIHSHPGDAVSYGAAYMFPKGTLQGRKRGASVPISQGSAWSVSVPADGPKSKSRIMLPPEARLIMPR